MSDDSDWDLDDDDAPKASNDSGDDVVFEDDDELMKKWGLSTDTAVPAPKTGSEDPAESLFNEWKFTARTGRSTASLSELTGLLAKMGIPGPRHFRGTNLRDGSDEIGQGSQFTVFRSSNVIVKSSVEEVIKRVRITKNALKKEKSLTANADYLMGLRHLELEVLGLSLLRHRNIVGLLGWGYDYDDRYTPVPVLIVESAMMSLTEFLEPGRGMLPSTELKSWDIRHHLALDIAAGVEAMHQYNIVHGDIKPDNVLIFRQDDPDVPFVAKLSDFGVCIDMRAPGTTVTPESYTGTPAWTGSEVGEKSWNDGKHGSFEPTLLLKFDSYSFGLTLLSIFATEGNPPATTPDFKEEAFDHAEELLEESQQIPKIFRDQLKRALRKLLVLRPMDRELPSPKLMQTDTPSYRNWLRVSATAVQAIHGSKGKGHTYWFSVDEELIKQLDNQYSASETGFSADTLFGMARRIAKMFMDDWQEKVLKYVYAAAQLGYQPAQAVCSKVHIALSDQPHAENEKMGQWERDAVSSGYLFAFHPFESHDDFDQAKQTFRNNGGYCSDPFISDQGIKVLAQDVALLQEWIIKHSVNGAIDASGNTILHACAAFGAESTVKVLLEKDASADVVNDAGETPLYKACQAGHAKIVQLLLGHGHKPLPSSTTKVSPLHWLFNFPDPDVHATAKALVSHGVDVHFMIQPTRNYGFAEHILSNHFPFEWPLGTPLHWAAFARSKPALDTLLDLGADINALYDNKDVTTTVLAQAVFHVDVPVVKYLLEKGADVNLVNSRQDLNLLHILSFGQGNNIDIAGKFDSWVRHGTFEARARAAEDVVRLLVQAGVDIEGKNSIYGKLTPLLQASTGGFGNEYVAHALIKCGADVNTAHASSNDLPLHVWSEYRPLPLAYPKAYKGIMEALITKTKDLNAKGGWEEDTALHRLARNGALSKDHIGTMDLILKNPDHHADINATNRDGITPLMGACVGCGKTTEELMPIVDYLLAQGAQPDIITAEGRNIITALASNNRRMDSVTVAALRSILSHSYFDPPTLSSFIAKTNIADSLHEFCGQGKPQTVSYLLDLGMSSCVHETNEYGRNSLDVAFSQAENAHWKFLYLASNFMSDDELNEANKNGDLYAGNMYGANNLGQPDGARAREAYFAYPEVFSLLQKCGAKRTERESSSREPSFNDAVQMPGLGVTPETQPNREHWQPLYDLEVMLPGWEEEAYQIVKDVAEAAEMFGAPMQIGVLDRWPKVVEELKADEEGWYLVNLKDYTKVKVLIEDEKITNIKDLKGIELDPKERWVWRPKNG